MQRYINKSLEQVFKLNLKVKTYGKALSTKVSQFNVHFYRSNQ